MGKRTVKKPVYKRVWFWVIVVFVILAVAGFGSNNSNSSTSTASSSTTASASSSSSASLEDTLEATFPKEDAEKALVVACTNSWATDVFEEDGNTYDRDKFHKYSDTDGTKMVDCLHKVNDGKISAVDDKTWHIEDLEMDSYVKGLLQYTSYKATANVSWDGDTYSVTDVAMTFHNPKAAEGYRDGEFDLLVENGDETLEVTPDLLD